MYYSKLKATFSVTFCILRNLSTEIGGAGIIRWKAPEDKKRADFPSSKSFALFGVEWVS